MFSALPSTRETGAEVPSQWHFRRHWKVSQESLNICTKTNSSPISSPCPSLYLHHSINSQLLHRTTASCPHRQGFDPVFWGILQPSANTWSQVCTSTALHPLLFHPCEQPWRCLIFRQVRGSHHQMELHPCMLSLVHLLSSPIWNCLSYLIYTSKFLCSFCIYLICCCLSVSKVALATFPTTYHNVVSCRVWGHTN